MVFLAKVSTPQSQGWGTMVVVIGRRPPWFMVFYLLLSTNLCFYDSKAILTPKMVLPHHAGNLFASK